MLVANLVVATQCFLASGALLTSWQAWTSLRQGLQENVWLAGQECLVQKMKVAFFKVMLFSSTAD